MSKNKPVKIKRALISVSNKEGIVNFAKKLHKLNNLNKNKKRYLSNSVH